MRVGILRGDLPGPVLLTDLEPVVADFPVDPVGQNRYLSRPTSAGVATAMANVPASVESSSNITFNLVVNGANNVLKVKVGSGAFTTVTIAQTTYTGIGTLVTAVNVALVAAGLAVVAEQGATNVRIRLKTTALLGAGASIALDTNGNGSIANASLGFAADGVTHTVPTAAAVITALNPVGGTLDVSTATQTTQISPAISAGDVTKIADAIAPKFVDSEIAIKSYQVGNLAGLRSSSFNPDPSRLPALSSSAAISVVQDDGVTAFSSTSYAGGPVISGAVFSGGNLTITGTGLGNSELINGVKVKSTNLTTGVVMSVNQRTFVAAGGSVSPTSIVVPMTLLTGAAVAGCKVQVKFLTLASNIFTGT